MKWVVLVIAVGVLGCPLMVEEVDEWRSLSDAIQDYRATVGYPTVISTTCCWSDVDYYGEYNYALVEFQSWSKYFYCYTSGDRAADGWFW